MKLFGILAAIIAALIVVSGTMSRLQADHQTAAFADKESIATVNVIQPINTAIARTLTLPGQLQALYSASIYARVPGYVRSWKEDIGAHVHKGQTLAVIETPELDQQIEQAKADLADVQAAEKFSRTTAERWVKLQKLDAVSDQATEEKTSDLATKTALMAAARANLDRLDELKKFARITAPFDGIVTDRTIDIGALVNAGAQSAAPALFTVVDSHKLRVYVSVPQSYSAQIRPGITADLSLPEYPGRTFPAILASTADAISEQSDSLRVELMADNAAGVLKPGEYAQVTLHLPAGSHVLRLPASALIFRSAGLQVATVSADNRIVMKPITIGRDLGAQVEVSHGLNPDDRIVDSPPDSLQSGDLVRVTKS